MIYLKTVEEIKKIRVAGDQLARLFEVIKPLIQPGENTLTLNDYCQEWMTARRLTSATLNYRGYPKSICTSINNVVCHGIPKKENVLREGDIVSVDIALIKDGYYADSCKTYIVGQATSENQLLVQRTEKALYHGIEALKYSRELKQVGKAIEDYSSQYNYGVVRELGGHGVGKFFHEDPFVPHYFDPKLKVKVKPGMIFTIEPMINAGRPDVFLDDEDKWTVRTEDSSCSAQFEHTVLITETGIELLTVPL